MNKRAQGFPELRSQALFQSHIRVIGHPADAKAEAETASAEKLSKEAEPLRWLYLFWDYLEGFFDNRV
jgi:hypothetical protein